MTEDFEQFYTETYGPCPTPAQQAIRLMMADVIKKWEVWRIVNASEPVAPKTVYKIKRHHPQSRVFVSSTTRKPFVSSRSDCQKQDYWIESLPDGKRVFVYEDGRVGDASLYSLDHCIRTWHEITSEL